MKCLQLEAVTEDGPQPVLIPDQHVVFAVEAPKGRTRLQLSDGTVLIVTIGLRQLLETLGGQAMTEKPTDERLREVEKHPGRLMRSEASWDERDHARGEAKAAEANANRKNKLISELQRQLSFAEKQRDRALAEWRQSVEVTRKLHQRDKNVADWLLAEARWQRDSDLLTHQKMMGVLVAERDEAIQRAEYLDSEKNQAIQGQIAVHKEATSHIDATKTLAEWLLAEARWQRDQDVINHHKLFGEVIRERDEARAEFDAWNKSVDTWREKYVQSVKDAITQRDDALAELGDAREALEDCVADYEKKLMRRENELQEAREPFGTPTITPEGVAGAWRVAFPKCRDEVLNPGVQDLEELYRRGIAGKALLDHLDAEKR